MKRKSERKEISTAGKRERERAEGGRERERERERERQREGVKIESQRTEQKGHIPGCKCGEAWATDGAVHGLQKSGREGAKKRLQ